LPWGGERNGRRQVMSKQGREIMEIFNILIAVEPKRI
jgi:hypothetical protein